MRTMQSLLDEYGESHQNPTNKLVHWFCVPSIVFSVIGLLYSVKLPIEVTESIPLNLAMIVLAITLVYYLRLSFTLSIGFFLFACGCLYLAQQIETSHFKLWQVSIAVFVIAWVIQFWGHKVEGKKPSFLKDVEFLMIGPAWLLHFIYKKLGIPY
ncbi:MAG: DUF962 domain-containing protein [Spirosomaceae bacterium]|nr:DUF962 domain-containing protein [Spirosomataceae bacterium]